MISRILDTVKAIIIFFAAGNAGFWTGRSCPFIYTSHSIITTIAGTKKCGRKIISQILDTETAVIIFFCGRKCGLLPPAAAALLLMHSSQPRLSIIYCGLSPNWTPAAGPHKLVPKYCVGFFFRNSVTVDSHFLYICIVYTEYIRL